MNLTDADVGDRIRFRFGLPDIGMDMTHVGEVVDTNTVPGLGDVVFAEVELPTRLIEYELRVNPDDDEEQVVKRLADDGEEVGTFGPILSVEKV